MFSQEINSLSVTQNSNSDNYFRLHYDNDYWAYSDDDYTQGVLFEFMIPSLKNNPVNKLFINKEGTINKYGLSMEHSTFTANTITSYDIQYGNRPFASVLYFKMNKISDDLTSKTRINSSFWVGVLGPLSLGEEGQLYIHEITGNYPPRGWINQIHNDVVLNYSVGAEKLLYNYGKFFTVYGDAYARVGTLYTDISVGSSFMLGLVNSPLLISNKQSKLQVYLYAKPAVAVIGYNATLQGGLFNRSSPYVITSSEVERLTARVSYGFVINYGFIYAEYYQMEYTKEFRDGQGEGWGGLKLGIRL